MDSQLARRLPARVQGYPWRLVYSTLEHGTSLKTLYRKSASLDSPVLLVIKDMDNQVRLVPLFFFFNFFRFIIYLLFLFLAVLGLCFCVRAFSSCGEWGPLFIAVRGPLTIAASLVAEHRLQTHRLSSCGSRAQLLRGMWDLPRPGLEAVSPALAGRFSTTAPPGKPCSSYRGRFF